MTTMTKGRARWLVLAVLVLGVGMAACSNHVDSPYVVASSGTDDNHPGYKDPSRKVSTEGFKLPDAGKGHYVVPDLPTTTLAAPPTTTTTTTPPPTSPQTPASTSITSVCGLTTMVGSMGTIFSVSATSLQRAIPALLADLNAYTRFVPGQHRAAFDVVRSELDVLATLLAGNGFDVHASAFATRAAPLVQHASSAAPFFAALDELATYEQATCPTG